MSATSIVYTGLRDLDNDVAVLRDGETFTPEESLKVRSHSPTGFNWSYNGSGPAQLALALLLDVTGSAVIAERFYQQFKSEIVSKWWDEWSISTASIVAWLEGKSGEKLLELRRREAADRAYAGFEFLNPPTGDDGWERLGGEWVTRVYSDGLPACLFVVRFEPDSAEVADARVAG